MQVTQKRKSIWTELLWAIKIELFASKMEKFISLTTLILNNGGNYQPQYTKWKRVGISLVKNEWRERERESESETVKNGQCKKRDKGIKIVIMRKWGDQFLGFGGRVNRSILRFKKKYMYFNLATVAEIVSNLL